MYVCNFVKISIQLLNTETRGQTTVIKVGCDDIDKIAYPGRDVTYMKFKKDDRPIVAFYVEDYVLF
jgi:hypothetical protein